MATARGAGYDRAANHNWYTTLRNRRERRGLPQERGRSRVNQPRKAAPKNPRGRSESPIKARKFGSRGICPSSFDHTEAILGLKYDFWMICKKDAEYDQMPDEWKRIEAEEILEAARIVDIDHPKGFTVHVMLMCFFVKFAMLGYRNYGGDAYEFVDKCFEFENFVKAVKQVMKEDRFTPREIDAVNALFECNQKKYEYQAHLLLDADEVSDALERYLMENGLDDVIIPRYFMPFFPETQTRKLLSRIGEWALNGTKDVQMIDDHGNFIEH
mgnify:CR=1 FL=1